MKRSDFRFFHRLRVRWAEVDQQEIVFNPHYLMYLATAISDYWRAAAMPYEQAMHILGGDIFLKKANIEFHASARMNDCLDVALRCHRIGTSSMLFEGAIFRDDDLLITSEQLYVFADPSTQRSKAVPTRLRALLQSYEAGESVFEVRDGSWQELGEAVTQVRADFSTEAQQQSLKTERAGTDEACIHAVAFNRIGQAISVGRLLPSYRRSARIDRVAVTRVLRGTGLGRVVVVALIEAAHRRGDREIVVCAPRSVEPFFRRLGFVPFGEHEAAVPEVEMALALAET